MKKQIFAAMLATAIPSIVSAHEDTVFAHFNPHWLPSVIVATVTVMIIWTAYKYRKSF